MKINKEDIETIIWIFLGVAFVYLMIHIGFYLTTRPQAEMKSPLQTVWETRVDLQAKFPDGVNGVEEMQGWTLQQWAQTFGWKENRLLKRYNPEAEKEYIYRKYLPLERTLQEISSHIYGDGYNCIDFSEDFQEALRNKGMESILIIGNTPSGYHEWVGVYFDPMLGNFVKVSSNYRFERVVSKGYWDK